MSIIQTVTDILSALPLEKQQEVLDFVEFLQTKIPSPNVNLEEPKPISFLMAAQEFAGCIDGGPGDLATNKTYLEGLGTE